MKNSTFNIYKTTGYTNPNISVPPLQYNATHLETKTSNKMIQKSYTKNSGNQLAIPPMLPIISKF